MTNVQVSEAFNLGCDARAAGIALAKCPAIYANGYAWRDGWRHIDSFWGKDAKWPVRCLPIVRHVTE